MRQVLAIGVLALSLWVTPAARAEDSVSALVTSALQLCTSSDERPAFEAHARAAGWPSLDANASTVRTVGAESVAVHVADEPPPGAPGIRGFTCEMTAPRSDAVNAAASDSLSSVFGIDFSDIVPTGDMALFKLENGAIRGLTMSEMLNFGPVLSRLGANERAFIVDIEPQDDRLVTTIHTYRP